MLMAERGRFALKELPMNRLIAAAGIVALMAACSPSKKSDYGTGLNTVDRKYDKSASETFAAAVAALKSYDIQVNSERHDALGGELVGERANGEKVTVNVSSMDETHSKASVRVEPGDVSLSNMIHEKMAEKLGMGTAKSTPTGGNTFEGYYDLSVKEAIAAAEKTAAKLGWTVVKTETKDETAYVDARTEESTPVRFRAEPSNDPRGRTRVTFIAGAGKTDQSKTLLSKMHDEFDRHAGQHAH
jgi:hypothetical protein